MPTELKNKTAILFDLDGTLSDNSKGILEGVRRSLQYAGVPIPPDGEMWRFIGPPLDRAFIEICGMSESEADAAVLYYREYYRSVGIFENVMYDGVPEMLKTLRESGRHLFVATSKPEEFSRRILEHFGIDRYFTFIGGATFDESRERKPDVIRYVMDTCGLECADTAMVGDRMYDIEGAAECGITPVGVLYGFGSRDELERAGAAAIAETVADIPKLFI